MVRFVLQIISTGDTNYAQISLTLICTHLYGYRIPKSCTTDITSQLKDATVMPLRHLGEEATQNLLTIARGL